MRNPFQSAKDQNNDVKRNLYDLSFQNNATFKFGCLTPVFCQEVLPTDSFQIEPTFALRFMPMTFPVQTRMKANLHFFYVRSRNLWKDFPDFIFKSRSGLEPPYLSNKDIMGTGSIYDYMGVPTTLYSKSATSTITDTALIRKYTDKSESTFRIFFTGSYVLSVAPSVNDDLLTLQLPDSSIKAGVTATFCFIFPNIRRLGQSFQIKFPSPYASVTESKVFIIKGSKVSKNFPDIELTSTTSGLYKYTNTTYDGDVTLANDEQIMISFDFSSSESTNVIWTSTKSVVYSGSIKYDGSFTDLAIVPYSDNPFQNGKIKLSALPFRAYESIYNSFYRDPTNNPYTIKGEVQTNNFIPSKDGGADTNIYKLHFRNWEPDFLTTAVQSPQQGVAPLVGITSTGKMTFQDESGKNYFAQAIVGKDGDTIEGIQVHSDDMPTGSLRALVDAVSSGISISDLRNVNSLQRFLEVNMRKGMRYKDLIEGHFGKAPRYDELDMPEFIGGVSLPVMVNQISQTAPTDGEPLGTYAGQASCMGSGKTISHYCDEHGFIIGILSVSPVPNYSQLLPKHFLKRDALDYYSPEFGALGYQPISYKEVCPLQANLEGKGLDGVFGYQRPWYEYVANVDEVHGQFRTTLQDFLINRQYDSAPELGEDFLLIDPKQVNDVFSITDESDDKILGQIYFKVTAKRPIPISGVARLE